MSSESQDDPRVPLAAERTLLAWIRTALAMMGFGFVVARFGLFLRETGPAADKALPAPSAGMSLWFGTGLVILGALTALLAAAQHVRFVDGLNRGDTYRPRRWSLGVLVAAVVMVVGVVMVGYLLLSQ